MQNIKDWQEFVNRNDVKKWAVKPSKPDERDFILSSISPISSYLPKKASLNNNVPFILDQKQTPKCVGFGMTGIMNAYYNFYGKLPSNGFSPEFAYWMSKHYDGLPVNSEGTTLRAVLKVAQKHGMLPWEYLPFRNNHIKPKITQKMMDIASQYKIKNYARLYNFEEICQAIASGKFVLIGSIVTKKDWQDGYILSPEGDYYIGSHCTYLSEYDLEMVYKKYKTFLGGVNSWGDWGLDGQYWMSKSFAEYEFKDMGCNALFEAWAIDMPELPKPEIEDDTPPQPEPKKEENKKVVKMYIGKKEYYINDQEFKMDTEPIIDKNNRTLVPVRAICEALGCTVNWDAEKKEITIIQK